MKLPLRFNLNKKKILALYYEHGIPFYLEWWWPFCIQPPQNHQKADRGTTCAVSQYQVYELRTRRFNSPHKSPLMCPLWNGQFQEHIKNTSGFFVCTWLDAYLELEQYLGYDWWLITRTYREKKYREERKLRNGLSLYHLGFTNRKSWLSLSTALLNIHIRQTLS